MLPRSVIDPLQAVSQLTAAVSAAATHEAILDAALDGFRDHFGRPRASILLFDDEGVLRFRAWRGLSEAYRTAVEGHTPWAPRQPAPAPIAVPDACADPSLADYRPVFEREGIVSLAFIPLIGAHGVIGKFMLYGPEPGAFSPDELHAAHALGFVVGLALERTQRAQEAERQHQRVLFALDAANMGTWEWDLHTQAVRWSENLERVHGLPPGTFTGGFESYEREIHPDDRTRVFASIQRALQEDVPHDVEYRIVAPDGTLRWVHGRGRVERDEHGRPARMSGVCMDISARRRMAAENERLLAETRRLLADEEHLRAKLTTLADGSLRLLTALGREAVIEEVLTLAQDVLAAGAYAVWTRAGNLWTIAASAGLSPEFTAARIEQDERATPFDRTIVASDVGDAPEVSSRTAAYRAEGIKSMISVPLAVRSSPIGSLVFYFHCSHEPSEGELRVTTALGHLAAAAISNAELYEEQQRIRRQAEAAELRAVFLAEASARLTTLDYEQNLRVVAQLAVSRLCDWCAVDLQRSDATLDRVAIAHVDPEKVAFAEAVHRRYPSDLSRPHGLGAVLRTGRPELYATITDDVLAQSAVDAEHLRLLREIGISSAMIVPLAAGARVFGAISFVNSTPGRHFDEADLAFAMELGGRAALAIENARLYTEAQTANRLKDEFLATLSHELRTPLNVILGRSRMLQQARTLDQVQQVAEVVERNGSTLAKLVEDLLDVSRMTIGQIQLERHVFRLSTAVTAAVQAAQAAADAKGIHLAVHVDPDLTVFADALRVQQIVWNLLTNAVKFTPAKGRVHVGARKGDDWVEFSVRDNGPGLSGEALTHVFDMFWQAEPLEARRYGGLGLGLAIVKKLAELHGGTVRAESAGRGTGATFIVTLPQAVPDTARSTS